MDEQVTAAPNPVGQDASDPLRPGWQSSEGQLAGVISALTALLAALTVTGIIRWTEAQETAVLKACTLVLTAVPTLYALARSHVKASALKGK